MFFVLKSNTTIANDGFIFFLLFFPSMAVYDNAQFGVVVETWLIDQRDMAMKSNRQLVFFGELFPALTIDMIFMK